MPLENPPSMLELAQRVGVSDRTLRRGFQELFGTTVFCYLSDKRMEWAEQLLRHENITVAEVAHRVRYPPELEPSKPLVENIINLLSLVCNGF